MSMTVLNAFDDSPDIGAMKFPAAPALDSFYQYIGLAWILLQQNLHNKVNSSELLHASRNSIF